MNKTLKHGDVRDDGLVFWGYFKSKSGVGESWTTKEKFDKWSDINRKNASSPLQMEKSRIRNLIAYHNNPEFHKKKNKEWIAKNRLKFRALKHSAEDRRRRNIKQTKTSKEDRRLISDIYSFCKILNRVHQKVMFHVDHIIPVCLGGQHIPENLRVTTAAFNLSKSANLSPNRA